MPKGLRKIRIGTAIFVRKPGTDKFLFGKRSDCAEWALPGGHLEEGETMEHCCHREVSEEFSIGLRKLKKLTFFKGYSERIQSDFVTLYFIAEAAKIDFTINVLKNFHGFQNWGMRYFIKFGNLVS